MYFPSIHDDVEMWPLFLPSESVNAKLGKVNPIPRGSAGEKYYSRPSKDEHNTTSRPEDSSKSQPSWSKSGPLVEPEYRPLEVFGPPAGGPRYPRSEHASDVCELSIRLKEMELCSMIGELLDVPRCEMTSTSTFCLFSFVSGYLLWSRFKGRDGGTELYCSSYSTLKFYSLIYLHFFRYILEKYQIQADDNIEEMKTKLQKRHHQKTADNVRDKDNFIIHVIGYIGLIGHSNNTLEIVFFNSVKSLFLMHCYPPLCPRIKYGHVRRSVPLHE